MAPSLPSHAPAVPFEGSLFDRARSLFAENAELLGWVAAISLALLVSSIVALPFVIARLPADYFTEEGFARREAAKRREHPTRVMLVKLVRNVAGLLIMLAGILMLILPGQGLLAILVGLMLIDYPGKHRFERRLVARPAVHRPLNWLRRKTAHPPFVVTTDARADDE
ncbi:MAG: PGPGW domain-containing protein [Planctomycetota bacterium]